MTSVEQKLRTIVTETFLIGNTNELHGDDSFIETGIIDSTGILQLVEFVEQEFGVKVDDEDLVPENLDSINRLVAFVERKKVLAVVGAEHAVPCSVGAGSPSSN
jgi:acyl carrier protein